MNTERYQVEWMKQAERDLRRIRDGKIRRQIVERVGRLAEDPRPERSRLINRKRNLRRIRVGDHRVLYSVFDGKLKVVVVRIGDRKDIYRRIS